MIQDKDKLLEAFRAAAHRQLDQWVDQQTGMFITQKLPTLRQMSDQFSKTRTTLLGGCLQEMAFQLTAFYRSQDFAPCPCCGKQLKRHSINAKTLHTMQGSITLERPYFYCHRCKSGYYPLDHALELANEAYQYDMQEKMLRLGIESPYDISADLFKELTGIAPSSHCLHETLNRIGTLAPIEDVIPSEQEIIYRIETVSTPDDELPVLVVASDGAHAPTRPPGGRSERRGKGNWREAKGFRIYLINNKDRIVQIASWHQIQDAAQFTKDLEIVAARIPLDRVKVALLGDGADWLWNAMVKCFPHGRQVLDYYHCAEHVHKVAKLQYGDSLSGQEWAEATITRLFMDQTGSAIGGLKRMQPSGGEADKEIRKLINYLTNHKHRLAYQECRDAGLPIGSGGIESANKHICHVRLKRSGAWWLEENGNTMLRLRCAMYNDTFDTVLNGYISKKRLKTAV
jgi:Uncharacterised protein family (UPF0236)